MDAPADKEDVRPYLKVTRCSSRSACTCRTCTSSDVARGLLLLEDLGTTPYLQRLLAGR